MKGIKLPATIRWAITNCLLLWLSMSLYRGFLLGLFLHGSASEILALFSGMVIDAGVLAFILVFYILLSLLLSLHPFKSRNGKLFGLVYFIFWGLVVALSYALDLVFIKAIQYRVYGSKILETFEDPYKTEVFFKNMSLIPMMFGIFFLLWIWGIIIVKLHSYIGRLSRVQSKSKRNTWNVGVIVAGIVLSIIAFSQYYGVKCSDLNLELKPVEALRINPVLSFFFV
jgi:hypothetical protein